jgi:hypothetical protein
MTLTPAELEQRQQAARTHGLSALAARGEAAMTEEQRSAHVAYLEELRHAEGVRAARVRLGAQALVMVDACYAWIREEMAAGTGFADLAVAARLPAYLNTAARILKDLAEDANAAEPDDEVERVRKRIVEVPSATG